MAGIVIVIIEHLYSALQGIYFKVSSRPLQDIYSALAYDVKYRYERIFSVSLQD